MDELIVQLRRIVTVFLQIQRMSKGNIGFENSMNKHTKI